MQTLRELYDQALAEAPSSFEAGELFRFVTKADPHTGDMGALVDDARVAQLSSLLQARTLGHPLQYILGEWEFYGLPFKVGPGVLIPRQDTETLVDLALERLRERCMQSPSVLDLCSGTGCVAVAIKHNYPGARVTALEVSDKAFEYLQRNIALNGVEVTALHGDLRGYEYRGAIDMVVANPPYIPKREFAGLQAEVKHEPILALDGGEDGMRYFRAIARRYKEQLAPGGVLLLEIGAGQQDGVGQILGSFGFEGVREHRDLNGIVRVVEATAGDV